MTTEAKALIIKLDWKGPFSISDIQSSEQIKPPSAPGVYIWTVAESKGNKIAYIGEAANLINRFHQHFLYTLGGGYCLYGKDYFDEATEPTPAYGPGFLGMVEDFIPNYNERSKLAYMNLINYRYFWAQIDYPKKTRESVESALIWEVKTSQHNEIAIQNTSVSRHEYCSTKIKLLNPFPSDTAISRFVKEIKYGELQFED